MPDHDFTDSIESELQGYETNNLQHEIQREVENYLLPQVQLPEQSARGQTDVYDQAKEQTKRAYKKPEPKPKYFFKISLPLNRRPNIPVPGFGFG